MQTILVAEHYGSQDNKYILCSIVKALHFKYCNVRKIDGSTYKKKLKLGFEKNRRLDIDCERNLNISSWSDTEFAMVD